MDIDKQADEALAAVERRKETPVAELPPVFEPGTCDAVAYNDATASRAYELVRRMPEPMRQARRMRFGFGRRTSLQELPLAGFKGHGCNLMILPMLYGSEKLGPEDFTWARVADGLYAGTLTKPGMDKMQAAAPAIEAADKASHQRMDAADAEEQAQTQRVADEEFLRRHDLYFFCTGYAGLMRLSGVSVPPAVVRELSIDERMAFSLLGGVKSAIGPEEFCGGGVPHAPAVAEREPIPLGDMRDFDATIQSARAACYKMQPKYA